ncbi:MaoC family dehydratase [Pseudodonghicola xiamenensis]|uniref:Nodulation protein NodN n=1 Tax=Pseudodonghicola xiamenensis TaxID=337702 RepID=A0A8J3H2Z3_9RHOB|nr:MaoC family dehydratase [Pseudodonghicola xiamenensis]GHG81060.1 nodulation protein NodN [Pseudodonghicola xiamenensis]
MTAIETAMEKLTSQIGTEIGVSNWITVDQAMINAFAEVTHDDQWIHIDPERAAKETPFGGSIAHGFLSLSLASRFAYDCFETEPGQVMGINYGFNKLRFLTPVKAGSRLRGRFTLNSVDQRSPSQILRETGLTVEIEGSDRPALIADWLGMIVFDTES